MHISYIYISYIIKYIYITYINCQNPVAVMTQNSPSRFFFLIRSKVLVFFSLFINRYAHKSLN